MTGVAEFDPPDTRADPMRIREQAQGFNRLSGQLTGQQDSLTFVLSSLAASFSEVMHPLISARIGEQFYTLQNVIGAMLYAEQVADSWAEDVVAFQHHRTNLMQRWESACSNGFWITRAPGYDNVEPEMRETLYDDARRRVLDELNAEAELAYAQLCTAANERGRQFGQGPTVANLLALLNTGPLGGSGSAILHPYLPVPGPDSGLPRRYWDLTAQQLIRASEDDPELAALLVGRRPSLDSADPFEAALALAVQTAQGDLEPWQAYGAQSADQIAEVARILTDIPPEELALLSALFPSAVGNLDGMPFEHRIAANRIRVADALHQAEQQRERTAAEAQSSAPPPVGSEGGFEADREAARQRMIELDARIEQYELLLTEPTLDYGAPNGRPWPDYRGRKIVYFDPTGDVAWAELVGSINSGTDDVGVFVPGVGTDATDMFNQSNQATEFVAAAARQGEQLAMIVWAGGDLPDTIPNALSERPAATLSGSLVDFSNAVRQEIDDQAGGQAVPLTVVGHSYGGLTVAASTLQGLSAERLLFVNSPGLCPWPVASVVIDRLEGYDSYAMAVPGDPVAGLGPLVHGPPPSAVGSLTQLDTGAYRDGTQILGPSGHSGVFEESSTAWENILAVLLGGSVVVN